MQSTPRSTVAAPRRALAILLGAFVAVHLCLSADAWGQPNLQRPGLQSLVRDDESSQRQRLIVLQAIVVTYVFVLGATLGSFFNVVIYRLPRGLNIVRPRSRCPCCATPIELRDNIPVVSWLRLRGRCRICGVAISPRYVLVETAVGLLFAGLVSVQVFSGGANLPLRAPATASDLFLSNWSAAGQLFAMSLWHACLVATLGVAALIQLDRQPVPQSLWNVALAIGLILPAIWPSLRPVPARVDDAKATAVAAPSSRFASAVVRGLPGRDAPKPPPWWVGIVAGAAGLFVGGLCGGLLSLAVRRDTLAPGAGRATLAAIVLVGVYLGWQAAVSVAVMSAVGLLLSALSCRAWPAAVAIPPLVWPAATTLLQVVQWKFLSGPALYWPGPFTPFHEMLYWVGGVALVSAVARLAAAVGDVTQQPK